MVLFILLDPPVLGARFHEQLDPKAFIFLEDLSALLS